MWAMCNCGNGRLGRYEGCTVYCTCRQGIEAELADLSASLQQMADELARLDALDQRGKLMDGQRRYRDIISDGYQFKVARYDELEAKYNREYRKPVAA